jgi:hypothetical protein
MRGAAFWPLRETFLMPGSLAASAWSTWCSIPRLALTAERDRLGCDWVLYVGDDKTDEDAFALCGNIVPVRIGLSQRSHARYYLRTQSEIDRLLAVLVRKNKPVSTALVGQELSPSGSPSGRL